MSIINEDRLVEFSKRYSEDNKFKINGLVTWKKGLRNRSHPKSGTPAVVVEVLPRESAHVANDHSSGSSYYMETLDLRIGLLDDDDDFVTFWVDSKRFKAFDAG